MLPLRLTTLLLAAGLAAVAAPAVPGEERLDLAAERRLAAAGPLEVPRALGAGQPASPGEELGEARGSVAALGLARSAHDATTTAREGWRLVTAQARATGAEPATGRADLQVEDVHRRHGAWGRRATPSFSSQVGPGGSMPGYDRPPALAPRPRIETKVP